MNQLQTTLFWCGIVGFLLTVSATGLYWVITPQIVCDMRLSHERTAPARMRILRQAQEEFKTSVALDRNGDGIGEYASDFSQLMGTSETLTPSARGVSQLHWYSDGGITERSVRSGYIFEIFTSRSVSGVSDPEQDQLHFAVAAWPVRSESPPSRCYVINETGVMLVFDNKNNQYTGTHRPVFLEDLYGTPFDPATFGQGGAQFFTSK